MYRITDTITSTVYDAFDIDDLDAKLRHIFAGAPVSHRDTIGQTIDKFTANMRANRSTIAEQQYLAVRVEWVKEG